MSVHYFKHTDFFNVFTSLRVKQFNEKKTYRNLTYVYIFCHYTGQYKMNHKLKIFTDNFHMLEKEAARGMQLTWVVYVVKGVLPVESLVMWTSRWGSCRCGLCSHPVDGSVSSDIHNWGVKSNSQVFLTQIQQLVI